MSKRSANCCALAGVFVDGSRSRLTSASSLLAFARHVGLVPHVLSLAQAGV
jgi:hypothetical protein